MYQATQRTNILSFALSGSMRISRGLVQESKQSGNKVGRPWYVSVVFWPRGQGQQAGPSSLSGQGLVARKPPFALNSGPMDYAQVIKALQKKDSFQFNNKMTDSAHLFAIAGVIDIARGS